MKVLLANKYNFLKGGADKYFLDLAALFESKGVKAIKFSMEHSDNLPSKEQEYFIENIDFNQTKISRLPRVILRVIYSREAKRKFGKLLDDQKPDIIHIHNIYHQISPSVLVVAKKRKIPIVMHLHDYKMFCPNYKMYNRLGVCEKCKGGKYYHCVLNKCLKRSLFKSLLAAVEMYIHHNIWKIYEKNIDLFIAPSDFMRQKAIEWGLEKEKITVLPYFIYVNQYKPDYNPGDYFLFWGRLSEEKGLDVLLDASLKVKSKIKIIGSGPEEERLKAKIKKLGLEKKVEMLGPKYGEELNQYIEKCLAAVVPSQWYEVFGIVNIEAAALGKPVIGARIGGISEAIKEGKNGFLFNPGDGNELAEYMKSLAARPDQAKQMGREGRGWVEEKFGPDRHYTEIIKIYKQVIGQK
jgi:glycosyltransferase involved in cell wall biosynthesis